MIRRLSPPPAGGVNWPKIRREFVVAIPQTLDVNEVVVAGASRIATYYDDGTEPTQAAVDAIAAAHVAAEVPSAADVAFQNDVATCKTYLANAAPTGADSVAAMKALMRVAARAAIRDLA